MKTQKQKLQDKILEEGEPSWNCKSGFACVDEEYDNVVEVIGNRFENPELCQGGGS